MIANELLDYQEGSTEDINQMPPQEITGSDPSLFARLGEFARDHTDTIRVVAGTLLTSAVCAAAPAVALANKRPHSGATPKVTPLSMESYVKLYVADTINYGQSFANGGAMNVIEHLDTTAHSVTATAPCNNLSGGKANWVRFVRDNMTGESEISCANGDAPAQHAFAPHSKYCVDPSAQPNCKDMNLNTAQQYVGSKVEAYIESLAPKYDHDSFGSVSRMAIDNYSSERETDLHLYLKKSGVRSSSSGRPVEEVSLYTTKGKESFSVSFSR